MESTVFPKPEVRRELDRFLFVKLYIDKPAPEGPRNRELRDKRFGSDDLPLYVLLDPDGKELVRLNEAELDPGKFAAFLRKGLPVVRGEAEVRLLSMKPKRPKVRIGDKAELYLELVVEPAEFRIVPGSAAAILEGPFEVGEVTPYEGGLELHIRVKDGAAVGPQEIKGKLKLKVTDGRDTQEKSVDLGGLLELHAKKSGGGKQDPLSGGLLVFLGLCVAGGAISLLMPCVYPLIPITLTFFVKQSGGSRTKSSLLALLYGAGIIVTFTGLGFVLSLVMGAAGAQTFAANPWVNLTIAVLFFALALSLLGWFELKLPSFLTDRVAGGAPKQGYLGAFGLGLIFSVVTFTCTIPIAASLMAMAAGGKTGWALLGMFIYSITMALPFLTLAVFPQLLQKIPRSGGWLHSMKVGTGFLELALAFYYLAKSDFSWGWGILSRDWILAIWVAVMLAGAAWLLGLWRFKEEEKVEHVGFGRALWSFAFAAFAFFLVSGLSGRHLGGFEAILPREKGKEFDDLQAGLEAAKKEKKLVFLEFTGFS